MRFDLSRRMASIVLTAALLLSSPGQILAESESLSVETDSLLTASLSAASEETVVGASDRI